MAEKFFSQFIVDLIDKIYIKVKFQFVKLTGNF